jgi:hypothetical protein
MIIQALPEVRSHKRKCVRLEVFTAMKIHVAVFQVLTLYSDMLGYKHFGVNFTQKMEAEWSSKMVS